MRPALEGDELERLVSLTHDYIADGIGSGAHPEEIAEVRRAWYWELREYYGGEVADAIYAAGYERAYGVAPTDAVQGRHAAARAEFSRPDVPDRYERLYREVLDGTPKAKSIARTPEERRYRDDLAVEVKRIKEAGGTPVFGIPSRDDT